MLPDWVGETDRLLLAGAAPSRASCAHLSELLLAPGGCAGLPASWQDVAGDPAWLVSADRLSAHFLVLFVFVFSCLILKRLFFDPMML